MLIGLAYVVDCSIIFQVLSLNLLVFRLLTLKLSSACSRVIQQLFLPSPLYLMSSGGSSSPSIHTPSSPPYSPYAMVSSLTSSSSNTIQISFGSIPTFSPESPGKALWVVWDIHPLYPPSGFVTATATPVIRIFHAPMTVQLDITLSTETI